MQWDEEINIKLGYGLKVKSKGKKGVREGGRQRRKEVQKSRNHTWICCPPKFKFPTRSLGCRDGQRGNCLNYTYKVSTNKLNKGMVYAR